MPASAKSTAKVAVIDRSRSMVTVIGLCGPAASPLQATKYDPAAAVAVSVTSVPSP
jgi:hypothetical protein